jgi:uncharacterized protein GlcG (DUF336 family)
MMSAATLAGATTLVALQVLPGGNAGGQQPDPTVTLPDDSSTTTAVVDSTTTTAGDSTTTTEQTGPTVTTAPGETTTTTAPDGTTTTTTGPTTSTTAVPGTPAPGLPQQAFLPLSVAQKLADATMADCAGRGFPVTVAVVDRDGVDILTARADGATGATVDVARGKAYAAAAFKTPTSVLSASPQASVIAAIPKFVVLAGGQPITSAGDAVGAIGVSGAPSGDSDDACATAGLTAVGADLGPATAR